MFAVIDLEATPDHLRGYLSRFLQEVRTGVYVGVVTSRVCDALWERVCEAAHTGSVVLITSDGESESGYRVRMHRVGTHRIVDLDGIHVPVETPRSRSLKAKNRLSD